MKPCIDKGRKKEPCFIKKCKWLRIREWCLHSDGNSFTHIEACPTPKNKTIDLIRYDGQRVAERVYDGKYWKMRFNYLIVSN